MKDDYVKVTNLENVVEIFTQFAKKFFNVHFRSVDTVKIFSTLR